MEKTKLEQEVAEFELGDLLGIGMTFVVLGIGLTYGLYIQSDVRADIPQYTCAAGQTLNTTTTNLTHNCIIANGSYTAHTGAHPAYTGATDSISAVAKLADKQGLIVTIVIAAVIIGILVRYLWVKFS